MNADLKFKAFHKELGMSVPFELLDLDKFMDTYRAKVKEKIVQPVFLPWTGLTLRGGEEIYRGDILRDDSGTWEVVFEDAAYIMKNGPHYQPLGHDWLRDVEKIGDIYQSKEKLIPIK